MPNYTFENTETGEVFVEFMKMDDKEQYLKDNPDIKFVFTPIGLTGDHIMGVGPKTDGGFNEVMTRIAHGHPNSGLADKYGDGLSHKDKKTKAIIKKHSDKIIREANDKKVGPKFG